jgi:hypothetical protein
MNAPLDSEAQGYDSFYREFDSPLMRQVRLEAYGEDIGHHSRVVAHELRRDIARLELALSSRFLDLGCGPCGPLTFVLGSEAVGFRLLETENRTESVLKNASGRLDAGLAHRGELEQLEGRHTFERQQQYLETVVELSQSGAMSRMMYLVESHSA